ncbi:hypothetical protein C8Q70DRAFT_85619 [Cubamyces menziesii]|nr:hypothetical protein C8Q70DRAFT_85619 [Cubamyces menziesii]
MHFGRSHARSKSRSPAPLAYNPTSTLASRPPNFLPPSHYAAAAGLTYAGDTRKANGTSPGPDGLCSASPVAYPTSEDSSSLESAETSSHFGAVGRLIGRTPSKRSTVLLSRSNSKGDKNDKEQDPHDNRKSQLGNIPLLEMHLLPSLRDTVDRMTQPPRQQVEYGELADLRPGSSLHSIASRAPHGTPDSTSSTNIPRLRSQPSPAYKSALKSPIRRNALPAATISAPSPHTTSRRSEPDRSTPLYESTAHPQQRGDYSYPPPNNLPITPRAGLKGPSALPKPRVNTKSRSNPSTPLDSRRYTSFATPQPTRPPPSPFQNSSLPRPKNPRRDFGLPSDSGSELERQVGRALSPGRLIVTNAVIVPSSSESDHATKALKRRSQWIAPKKEVPPPPVSDSISSRPTPRQTSIPWARRGSSRPPAEDRRTIGLGLNVEGGFDGGKQRFAIDEDDVSVYEDEHDVDALMDEPALIASSDGDDESIYGEPSPPVESSRRPPLPRRPSNDRRNLEALQGIVDGLHREYRGDQHTVDDFSHSESEAGDDGHGMAIGASTDLQLRSRSPYVTEGKRTPSNVVDDESMYSEEEAFVERVPSRQSVRSRYARDDAFSESSREDSPPPAMTRSPMSLRQNRTSWKRPSSSLAVHDNANTVPRSPSASPHLGERKRPISPRMASVPPAPQTDTRDSLTNPPMAAHRRSKSSSHTSRSSRKEPAQSKRNSRRQSAEAGPRSSRLLTADGTQAGLSPRYSDDPNSRERLAFGIPESLSYGGNVTPDEHDSVVRPPFSRLGSATSIRPGLSRADSDLSVAEAGWEDQARVSKELSKGAAALLDALACKAARSGSSGQRLHVNESRGRDATPLVEQDTWLSRGGSSGSFRNTDATRTNELHARRRSFESVSEYSRSSPRSQHEDYAAPVSEAEYEDTYASPPQVVVHEASNSWRATLSEEIYNSLNKHYGQIEMERQELIYALLVSEQAFVRSARRVVRAVLLPLRARDTRAWLPGLPQDVTRFFDWLEDIVNLHIAIAHALSAVTTIWQKGSIVQRLAGTLKGFVPRLEVYMPYLARNESVQDTLKWYAEQDEGEFGEYLRLKEQEREQCSWSLERLLEEPAMRLKHYLDTFQRLHDTTPLGHPDYLATLSLLYSTRTAVRVMEEVKRREDEYDFVKELSSRIDGLPTAPPLARRARRLLWYGSLECSVPETSRRSDCAAQTPSATPRTGNGNLGRVVNPQQSEGRTPSRLATAIRDWKTRRSRAGSFSSSLSSTLSVQTYETTSSASSASVLVTPRSDQFPSIRITGRNGAKGHARSPQVPQSIPESRVESRTLNVMVFSDMILLAVPSSNDGLSAGQAHSDEEERSRLLEGIGLSRILGVAELGERSVSLNLVPIPLDQLDTGITVENTPPTTITLSIAPSEPPETNPLELLKALRKCHHHTARGLSYPSLPAIITDDLELDTRQSLAGILSSGLPLPKSPSMQFEEAARDNGQVPGVPNGEDAGMRGEREERGWWTLRFQQVLREMQREEVPVALVGE